jgi:hypothetical protein
LNWGVLVSVWLPWVRVSEGITVESTVAQQLTNGGNGMGSVSTSLGTLGRMGEMGGDSKFINFK